MTNLGLPVPAGFTIGTNVCTYYYEHERTYPPSLRKLVDDAMAKVESEMGASSGPPRTRCWFPAAPRSRFDARHDGHRA